MRLSGIVAWVCLALAASGALLPSPATAACTSTVELGSLGAPSTSGIGNVFGSTQHFNDCYNFTLTKSANTDGIVFGLDASLRRDIDLGSIILSGGGLSSSLVDISPSAFSFDNLLAGDYQLVISGDVTGRNGGLFGGGLVYYNGILVTTAASVPAVPEPQTYALLLVGFAGVGFMAYRRNNKMALSVA
jgi:hypothetical protein